MCETAYNHGQIANLFCTVKAQTPKEATIVGTNGSIRIHSPFWCTTKISLTLEGKETQDLEFPLPSSPEMYFVRSIGLHYQAKHFEQCIARGLRESNIMSNAETLTIMKIMDAVRQQIGVVYPQEKI